MARRKVIYVADGKDAATVKGFADFLEAPASARRSTTPASTSGQRSKRVKADFETAEITFDNFRVVKTRQQGRRLGATRGSAEQLQIKGRRYIFLKNVISDAGGEGSVVEIGSENLDTIQAIQIRMNLRQLFTMDAKTARRFLDSWNAWVQVCDLGPMKRLAKTIMAKAEGILRSIATGLSNGVLEAINSNVQAASARPKATEPSESQSRRLPHRRGRSWRIHPLEIATSPKIGRDVVIQCKSVPVCTDLLTIGSGAVLRKYSLVKGYKAQSGYICTGPVTIGENTYVGEASVLDIYSCMEDRSQLGHSSNVPSGMKLARAKRYHGSPAVECSANYDCVEPIQISLLRKVLYPALVALVGLFVAIPIIPVGLYLCVRWLFDSDLHRFAASLPQISPPICARIFLYAAIALCVSIAIALVVIAAIPRVLHLLLQKGHVYPLYGLHYLLYNIIDRMTNSVYLSVLFWRQFCNRLFSPPGRIQAFGRCADGV